MELGSLMLRFFQFLPLHHQTYHITPPWEILFPKSKTNWKLTFKFNYTFELQSCLMHTSISSLKSLDSNNKKQGNSAVAV